MCECYKIGGPWIDFDPECPAHGYEAQRKEREQEQEKNAFEERIRFLESRVDELQRLLEGK